MGIIMNVGFDLVGTLVERPRSRNPQALLDAQPRYIVLEKLFDHIKKSDGVSIISARTISAESAITELLNSLNVPSSVKLVLQPTWMGVDEAIRYKANKMKELNLELYYGDSERIDQEACKIAKVKFIQV